MFMIIWLASYPRSGNTFFRALLHRLFGFQTHSVYPEAKSTEATPADIRAMQRLVGGEELERDLGELESESRKYFIKTHDLPKDDTAPAVVLVRDGRDALVSYTHFVLRTARGIEHATSDVFEATLEEIIVASHFGGWSANVNAWIERAGWDSVVRYEELIQDPVNIVVGALRRLGLNNQVNGASVPSFQELHAIMPWFFRSGKPGSWPREMPPRLQQLFLEKHGDTLLRLGYPEGVPS